ncbi:MAG: hypothetical protein L3J52_05095 [Proteobacteria bacterium]|nr:hypothetical protein [Pseudomonadota bacterium]
MTDLNNQKKTPGHWAHTKERGSLFGIYLLAYVFKIFGARVCKVMMTPMLVYFCLFNRSARASSYLFLQKISRYDDVDVVASRWNVFKIMFNFGYGMVDKLGALTGRFPLKNIIPVHDEDFRDCEKKGVGALLLISHLGNFEMSRAGSRLRSTSKFNIFMHTKNSEKITKLISSLDKNSAVSILQGDDVSMATIMNLKEKIDAGEFVVIAGDRIPVNSDIHSNKGTIAVNFLGDKARFPIGPFVLSKVLACPVISLFSIKEKDKYNVYFNQITEKVVFNKKNRNRVLTEIITTYVRDLEKYAKKAPLQWYNFHRFWVNK